MWPSIFTTFPRPSPTDRLNNPSHSGLENLQSSTIGQVQAFIGNNSSVQGTLLYDVRSPLSNGGGHIQTAAKGGTGQTIYTKGDMIVASGSSVLSKLAVGTDNQVLLADSTTAVGVKWATNPNSNKIAINVSSISFSSGQTSLLNTWYSTTIPGSTLGTNNVIRYTANLQRLAAVNNSSILIMASYGNNVISSIVVPYSGSIVGAAGKIEGFIGIDSNASQIGTISLNAVAPVGGALIPANPMIGAFAYGAGNSSVNSSASQTLTISGQLAGGGAASSVLTGMFIVEKIS